MATATAECSKLELLQARESELAIAVDEARARIALYPEQLHEARSRAIYAKPNVRPGAELNGEVAKLNAKERKDVDGLRSLEADLSACRGLVAIEAQRVTDEETAEARELLQGLHVKQEAIYQRAGELLGELTSVWNSLVEVVEEESQVATANRLEAPGVLAVEPVPSSFRAFLLLLHVAATDPTVHAEPHVQELTETGIFGRRFADGNPMPGAVYDTRPAGTKTTEVRRRLDHADRLHSLIPDLRGVVMALKLSGKIPSISE
jgi:hypothetical protein